VLDKLRHRKKGDAAKIQNPILSYEKTENFDTYDAISKNFNKNGNKTTI
jgi:hypothetical protein